MAQTSTPNDIDALREYAERARAAATAAEARGEGDDTPWHDEAARAEEGLRFARVRRDCRELADALANAGYEAEAMDCLRDTNADTLEHAEERQSALFWLMCDLGIKMPAEARA